MKTTFATLALMLFLVGSVAAQQSNTGQSAPGTTTNGATNSAQTNTGTNGSNNGTTAPAGLGTTLEQNTGVGSPAATAAPGTGTTKTTDTQPSQVTTGSRARATKARTTRNRLVNLKPNN